MPKCKESAILHAFQSITRDHRRGHFPSPRVNSPLIHSAPKMEDSSAISQTLNRRLHSQPRWDTSAFLKHDVPGSSAQGSSSRSGRSGTAMATSLCQEFFPCKGTLHAYACCHIQPWMSALLLLPEGVITITHTSRRWPTHRWSLQQCGSPLVEIWFLLSHPVLSKPPPLSWCQACGHHLTAVFLSPKNKRASPTTS